MDYDDDNADVIMGGLATLRALGFTLTTGPSMPPAFLLVISPSLFFSFPSPAHPRRMRRGREGKEKGRGPSLPFSSLSLEVELCKCCCVWENAVSSPVESGAEPSGNRLSCILALKSDIRWHRYY